MGLLANAFAGQALGTVKLILFSVVPVKKERVLVMWQVHEVQLQKQVERLRAGRLWPQRARQGSNLRVFGLYVVARGLLPRGRRIEGGVGSRLKAVFGNCGARSATTILCGTM